MLSYFASLNPAALLRACPGGIAQGLIWGIMALGVYMTYRMLGLADLTVDGSLATGGAVTVMLLLAGMPAWAALLIALEYGKKRGSVSGGEEKTGGMKGSYASMVVGTCALLTLLLHVPTGGFEIDYLDVGQGDGSMLRTEEGVVCFVDGGSADVSGVGTYRILPFLKSKGIQKVDYWVLSHLDEDHVSGFYEVLEAGYRVDAVVISAQMPEDEAKVRLLGTLAQYKVSVIEVCGGDFIRLQTKVCIGSAKNGFGDGADEQKNSDALLYVLSPDVATPVYDCNGASLVCLYEDAHVRALWTGDIGKSQEEWLMNSRKLHEIDIYKAAHHGSGYSNSEEYLKLLSPKLSVISCGKYNRYGHPDAEAIEHIQAAGSRIMYTMKSGQVKVKACEDGLVAEEFVPSSTKR